MEENIKKQMDRVEGLKQQQMMQELYQEKKDLEATYFEEALRTEIFPTDKISKLWKQVVVAAMTSVMPFTIKISLKEFKEVLQCLPRLDKGEPISLFEFGVLSNSVESVSMKDLNITPSTYCKYIEEALEHIEYWGKRNKIIRADAEKKASSDIQLKLVMLSKAKENNLKPVAEA